MLYLPAVRPLNGGGGPFFSAPCLYRNFDRDRMTLPYLVHALWGVLTADAHRLNSPEDAMHRDAAVWFLDRKHTLELPLDSPLRGGGVELATPRGPSLLRFPLEEL